MTASPMFPSGQFASVGRSSDERITLFFFYPSNPHASGRICRPISGAALVFSSFVSSLPPVDEWLFTLPISPCDRPPPPSLWLGPLAAPAHSPAAKVSPERSSASSFASDSREFSLIRELCVADALVDHQSYRRHARSITFFPPPHRPPSPTRRERRRRRKVDEYFICFFHLSSH